MITYFPHDLILSYSAGFRSKSQSQRRIKELKISPYLPKSKHQVKQEFSWIYLCSIFVYKNRPKFEKKEMKHIISIIFSLELFVITKVVKQFSFRFLKIQKYFLHVGKLKEGMFNFSNSRLTISRLWLPEGSLISP